MNSIRSLNALRGLKSSFSRLGRANSRLLSTSAKNGARVSFHRSKVLVGSIVVAGGVFGYLTIPNKIQADSSVETPNTISVDSSVSPFPTEISDPLSTKFKLLGYGTRAVTFVGFKVYALGLYVAEEDFHLIPEVFDSKFLTKSFIDHDSTKSHQENLLQALKDPKTSTVLISNLLDSGIRFTIRIVPVRNTDFNHLRDGLIKSILAYPESRNHPELKDGLDELRQAFGRKGSVPKDHVLFIERLKNGSLQLRYQNMDVKEKIVKQNVDMGKVDSAIVSKILLLSYLSGSKPLSPSTRDVAIEKLSLYA